MRYRLTKMDMSRVIVQARFDMDTLPTADDPRVTFTFRHAGPYRDRPTWAQLKVDYDAAHATLTQRLSEGRYDA